MYQNELQMTNAIPFGISRPSGNNASMHVVVLISKVLSLFLGLFY